MPRKAPGHKEAFRISEKTV